MKINAHGFHPSTFLPRSSVELDVSVGKFDCSLFCEKIVIFDMELIYWPLRQYLLQTYCMVGVMSEVVVDMGETSFLDRKPTLP